MSLYALDPCEDTRWTRFLDRHPDASVFHTPAWLETLRRSYGYEPFVYTTTPPGRELRNGQVFCRIKSWLTGRRIVSLPFSDHVAMLIEGSAQQSELLSRLQEKVDDGGFRYIEFRPTAEFPVSSTYKKSDTYHWHTVSLTPELPELFSSFHKSCVQRKIRRAFREKLDYSEGRSERLIREFHRLQTLTQRRHSLPPQPLQWFLNMAQSAGPIMKIRVASKDGRAVAAILTLAYKKTMVYKYGASDERAHNLGGMHFLFWKTIEESKVAGMTQFDLGRSDDANPGLIAFKEHWGAQSRSLHYWRYPGPAVATSSRWELRAAKRFFSLAPASALPAAGRLLYPHIG